MTRISRSFMFLVLAALVCCSAVSAAPYPTVSLLSFNPSTFEYLYQVQQDIDGVDGFGQFEVDSYLTTPGAWSASGPVSNLFGNEYWMNGDLTWSNPPDPFVGAAYNWYGGNVPPGAVLSEFFGGQPWIGTFSLIVPDSAPVPGMAITVMATNGYRAASYVDVPGLVPEPSGFLALSVMLLGAVPVLRRLRR